MFQYRKTTMEYTYYGGSSMLRRHLIFSCVCTCHVMSQIARRGNNHNSVQIVSISTYICVYTDMIKTMEYSMFVDTCYSAVSVGTASVHVRECRCIYIKVIHL